MATETRLAKVSGFFGLFRGFFMPLGLFALVAIGVHAAADVVDDRLLSLVDALDAWADGWLARSERLAPWVDRVGPLQRTIIARSIAVAWELAVAVLVVVPQLGYGEADEQEARFSFRRETWRTLFGRLNRQPTPMRLVRPVSTAIFVAGGAYAIARLVESTLFVALQNGVASPETAELVGRIGGVLALGVVLVSHGWRAVLRALEHADAACEEHVKRARSPWGVGTIGSALAFPLALALVLEAQNLLALVR